MTLTPDVKLSDSIAFGDPARKPRCAQGGPEIANLFTSYTIESRADAEVICRGCPLGPNYTGDICANWRRGQGDAITTGMTCGGKWFAGRLDAWS